MRKPGPVKPRNHLAGLEKLLQGKYWFAIATTISKRANSNVGIKISRHTISRRLNEINLNSQVASTKPYISKKNKISQLKYIIFTEEQWIVFISVMSQSLNLFGCDGRMFVQRSPKERYLSQWTKSSTKFRGGSVMVFGMIPAASIGPLVRLHSKVNATVCKEILKKHVPNLRTALNQSAVFMKDNALYHTAKSVKTVLSEENVAVMKWPAQNPDINPVENVWKLLNERAKENNPINVEELWTNLNRGWDKISVD